MNMQPAYSLKSMVLRVSPWGTLEIINNFVFASDVLWDRDTCRELRAGLTNRFRVHTFFLTSNAPGSPDAHTGQYPHSPHGSNVRAHLGRGDYEHCFHSLWRGREQSCCYFGWVTPESMRPATPAEASLLHTPYVVSSLPWNRPHKSLRVPHLHRLACRAVGKLHWLSHWGLSLGLTLGCWKEETDSTGSLPSHRRLHGHLESLHSPGSIPLPDGT